MWLSSACPVHPHKARIHAPGFFPTTHYYGYTPKPDQGPPQIAPTDLRTVALPPAWQTMRRFQLQNGNTEYLPDFPPTLEFLYIGKNNLKELPALPEGIIQVHVDKNKLTALPELPDSLGLLYANYNRLTAIPAIPASLLYLHVSGNQITALPSLADTNLTGLGIGKNQLTVLPALPATLQNLSCPNNQIREIKNLPDSIETLICSNNPLQTLEVSNLTDLETLVANNCGIVDLPLLPGFEDNGEHDFLEDRRAYYFNGNPLAPDFAAAYATYLAAVTITHSAWGGPDRKTRNPGSTRAFRKAIYDIYQRRKSESLTSIQRVFKAPMIKRTEANWYYGPQVTAPARAMYGNYNPTNIVAEFLTGVPGTIEMQKLAILEERERAGAVPPGTAAAARERIADIAASGPSELASRAALYVKKENVDAARARLAAAAAAGAGANTGGRRKRITRRKRKSSRLTRKH